MLNQAQIQSVTALVKKVGVFQINEQQKIVSTDINEKSLNQLVSYVDVESEKKLVEGLQRITPTCGFLTEEETTTLKNDELYWIIDPLDGTTNFLFQHRQFSISIALVSKDKTVFGCVYIPADKEMFIASPDGAYLNGNRITVSSRSTLQSSLIATGFPYYTFNELDSYLEVLKVLMKETKGLRRMGSAAIDLAYTALGKFDGFFELNLSPWDVAAGAYIVKQSGGMVTDFKGGSNYIFGKSIIAGNMAIGQELSTEILKHHF
jgi:myo-inositol-1(or 4)-monophosphatase